jgi:hypothetical protein
MPVSEAERREIHSLRDQGASERAIAKTVGFAASTIHEVLQAPPPEAVNGNGHGEPTPGQQTIDGGEVQPQPVIEEVRVDGTTQLGLIDFGGKQPQNSTLTLTGGQFDLVDGKAFRKGDDIHFAGVAKVFDVGGVDKLDRKTMIATTAVQKHKALMFDLVSGAEADVLRGMFRRLVDADRQRASALADEFVRLASGGSS